MHFTTLFIKISWMDNFKTLQNRQNSSWRHEILSNTNSVSCLDTPEVSSTPLTFKGCNISTPLIEKLQKIATSRVDVNNLLVPEKLVELPPHFRSLPPKPRN